MSELPGSKHTRLLSSEFVRSFRISLGFSERDMATFVDIEFERYLEFEWSPVSASSKALLHFQSRVISVCGPHYNSIFQALLDSDVKKMSDANPKGKRTHLRVVAE